MDQPKDFYDTNIYCDKKVCNASHWQSLVEVEISDPSVVTTNTTTYFLDFDNGVMNKVAE